MEIYSKVRRVEIAIYLKEKVVEIEIQATTKVMDFKIKAKQKDRRGKESSSKLKAKQVAIETFSRVFGRFMI